MAPKLKRKTRNKSIRKDDDKSSVQDVKREKLLRELKLSALNTERNQRFWRETLTRVKMPDVWRKIDVTWQTLERAIDFKDYSVSLLLDSLQEAENQRRTINGTHVELIDKSLEAHVTRLADANTLFYGNVKTMLADKISQFENINYYRNKKEIALRKINLLVSHRGENASNVARSTAISRKKDKHKTTTMSKEYNRGVKHMRGLLIKAERILGYMQICRKYETQDEKILPTIDNHPAVKDFQRTINFWRRLGFAQIITTELRTERNQLMIQANNLRKLMKRCLIDETGSTCFDAYISTDHDE
ncbi:hypothetical protein K0M31_004171 [Melipona bicolor]|uniref:Dynein regulatory complex protein 1/2 N-terminal domain-containing protein n=1 Tax=Melipona bicolor TaxID=60889 RepID=A0AA40FW98_9HYME|nr:hypothetical protein K0M31_004171 [Melipona bicolor]